MPVSTSELVGAGVQWFAGLLVLLLIHHLSALGTARRVTDTWRGAWVALLLALSGFIAAPLLNQVGERPPHFVVLASGLVFAGGKLAFLTLVFLGAMQSVNRPVRRNLEYGLVFVGSTLGALIALEYGQPGSAMVHAIVTPIAMFGAAAVVWRAEAGARGVGLRRMVLALGAYGALWASYLAIALARSPRASTGDVLVDLSRSGTLAEALVASALGASIVFLLVQDRLLEVGATDSPPPRHRGTSVELRPAVVTPTPAAIADVDHHPDGRPGPPEDPGRGEPVDPLPVLRPVLPDRDEQSVEVTERPESAAPPLATAPTARNAVLLPRPIRLGGGRNAAVMIIANDSAVRATVARMFQRGGWPVRQAASYDAVLSGLIDVTDAELPAVIICDLTTAGMDGRDLYALLKARRPAALSRLMFVSGDAVDPAMADFLTDAARPVVEKPFTVAEIAGVVEELLEGQTRD